VSNGTQAVSGDFPYVISVAYKEAHLCGGLVYNEKFIVTVASCVYEFVDNSSAILDLKVVAGQVSLISPDPGEQSIGVKSIFVFPGYNNQTWLHDIALIEVTRPFVFSDTVKFIFYEEIDDFGECLGTTMGWGTTNAGGIPSTRLRYANITLLSSPAPDCRIYGQNLFDPNYMFCAGLEEDGRSPCNYDQGSPLVQLAQNNILFAVGIVSKNQGCGDPFNPSIYTRLAAYYPWLLSTAGQQPAPSN